MSYTFNGLKCKVEEELSKGYVTIRYFNMKLIVRTCDHFVNITKFQETMLDCEHKNIDYWDHSDLDDGIREFYNIYYVEDNCQKLENGIKGIYVHPDLLIPFIIWCNPRLYVAFINSSITKPSR